MNSDIIVRVFKGYKRFREEIGEGMYFLVILSSRKTMPKLDIDGYAKLFSAINDEEAKKIAKELTSQIPKREKRENVHLDSVLCWLGPTSEGSEGVAAKLIDGDCPCDFEEGRGCKFLWKYKRWYHDHVSFDTYDSLEQVLPAVMATTSWL